MLWIKRICQASLLTIGLLLLQSAALALSAVPQFAQCIKSQKCADKALATGGSLACCKSCLGAVKFSAKQKLLQKMMSEHLDLMCAQFENPQILGNKTNEKPYAKLFLAGQYEHTSGKDGCHRDRIMWTAPIDLYIDGSQIKGSTDLMNGTIRVYPLARCEDGQVGEVLASDELQVHVTGNKTKRGNHLKFVFDIAKPPAADKQAQHTQLFVDIISRLISLSMNTQNRTLEHWFLSTQDIHQQQVQSFTTNAEARKRGWKGQTQVFV
jgi:hypothetical protein